MTRLVVSSEPPDRLSAIERQVVDIALRDTWFSVPSRDRLIRAVQRRVQGRKRELADPRLETLRRYLVLHRRTGSLRDTEHEVQLIAAGFSEEQVREAEALTDASRAVAEPFCAWSLARVILRLLLVGAGVVWLADLFENMLVAAIVIGVALATLMSFGVRGAKAAR